MLFRKTSYIALSALLLVASATTLPAQAAPDRQRDVTFSNSQGKSATRTTNIMRNDGVKTKTISTQTGKGYGASATKERGYDSETGSRFANKTITTNSGETATRATSADCADGSCSRASEITGVNGNTAYRDVSRNGEGEKTTTITGPNGESKSRTRWINVE